MRSFIFLLFFSSIVANGQNTLQLTDGQKSPKADLELVSWLEGHWRGKAFGGVTEEMWSPIEGNSMMFVFRHLVDDKVTFYEVGHIKKRDESLVFELRHFDTDLHAWEEKHETQQFNYIKADGNRVYFDGFTFEHISANEMNIYGLIENDEGIASEVTFTYKKQ